MLAAQLPIADEVIIVVNLAGAAFAAVLNIYTARRWPAMRTPLAVTAGLACLYIVAYLVLLFTPVSVTAWGSFMRGVSVVVWFGAPWSLFALQYLHLRRKARRVVDRRGER